MPPETLPDSPKTSIADRLLRERHALLDLSTRNRLLNTPLRTRNNRAIEIVDEKPAEVFRLLGEGKTLTFLPGAEAQPEDGDDTDTAAIPQPADETVDERGVAARHADSRLQTRLTSEGLQKRLFDIWDDARTLESEQGVNILYLALGLVRWYDAADSEVARHAPLVLLPVQLERNSAADRFRLKGRDEPPSPNLTLQAKMKADFGLVIEDFGDEDAVDLDAYAARVAETVAGQARWEVLPDAMVLGFFSFAKFLMYRDLDPDNWPQEAAIGDHALITALLREGFPASEPLIADDADIDDALPVLDLRHVVDADSSQAVAIAEAAGGRTLVVKGPPGTGKSQTITNIIAAAVAAGRKVLFVAEKMAALDVVHRRLKQAGLGPLALELHSNKISKRAVLEELRRTRDMAPRPLRDDLSVIQRLSDVRGDLNAFADRLHTPLQPSGLTPHAILGRLAKWSEDGEPGRDLALDGADGWTAEDVARRRGLAEDITERLATLGPVPGHPWRGVGADPLDPAQTDSLRHEIATARDSFKEAEAQAVVATRLLGAPPPETVRDLDRSLAFLQLTPLPRDIDRAALGHDAWRNTKALEGLVTTGKLLTDLRGRAGAVFGDAGLTADYTAIRADIVTKGSDLFRFLDGGYKRNIALLRSYMKDALPNDPGERLKRVDLAVHLQQAETAFARAEPHGAAFGRLWLGADSDWDALDNIVRWHTSHRDLPAEVWPKLAALPDAALAEAGAARQVLHAATAEARRAMAAAFTILVLDWPEQTLDILTERFSAWLGDMESLSRFIAFAWRGRQLAAQGAGAAVGQAHKGELDSLTFLPAFDGAYTRILRDALFRNWPELKAFDGEAQGRRVAQFRQLDSARIDLARDQIAARHAEDRPRASANMGAGIGPLGVLNGEMAKKSRHLPIRVLLEKAGPAIQQLKPVFMMSPLSVAQFLKPGALDFDLLVMDEASQIEPVDALGAVARARQLVVVGDERQLPPTAFFKKLTGEDEEPVEDDVTIQARDAESILDLCLAKGAPYRLLSWHYRSRHQSLIAVSNREFYDNRLFIVPSPYDAVAGMGLKFHLLKDAPYDRGGSRTNPKEAKIVAEAVLAHARTSPGQSLGVAAFSVSQRTAILKELELLRRANPQFEDFFAPDADEPFFVKNLENIQGDERDVIFISMGYGKTAEGYLAHNFGPLSGEGGERRLNVLISRAKLRCEVFSNFTGADIDLERTPARGVAALKMFLTFAETGHFGQGMATSDDHDSLFEDEVARKLRGLGYDVKAQIGASGFRVDLAVADSEKPGRFVLGIECDGAQYHSSRSARDRDRLRQQVLEAHGWVLHRIWSADWYLRPKEELRKLEAAIAAAKIEWRERDEAGFAAQQAVPLVFETTDTSMTAVVGQPSPVVAPNAYAEAAFAVDRRLEPTDLPLAQMAGIVTRIVAVEGPVHGDEVMARVRQLWDLPRVGPKFKAAVTRALDQAAKAGQVSGGPFYRTPDQAVTVRDRSGVASATLRKPDMLPPDEIDLAVITMVADNFGATRAELVTAVARQLGFSSTSAPLRSVLEGRIASLTASGALVEKGDLLTLP